MGSKRTFAVSLNKRLNISAGCPKAAAPLSTTSRHQSELVKSRFLDQLARPLAATMGAQLRPFCC